MSAPKFTHGPWKLDGGDPRYVRSVKTKEYIAARQSSNPADSALLAAAPELYGAAAHAQAWISDMPHGDNCYLSAHYDGDPGDQCNCGKESVLAALDAALAKAAP
jgi:hypothetical protein